MRVLLTFIFITIFIFTYLVFYLKVDVKNILDIMHSAFIRQLIFEIIPFFVLFNVRDISFINIASAPEFFNSVIGRSIMGMIGFTFVSYVITAVAPKKIELNNIPTDKKEDNDEKEVLHINDHEKDEQLNESVENQVKDEGIMNEGIINEGIINENFGQIGEYERNRNINRNKKYKITDKNSRLFERLINKLYD